MGGGQDVPVISVIHSAMPFSGSQCGLGLASLVGATQALQGLTFATMSPRRKQNSHPSSKSLRSQPDGLVCVTCHHAEQSPCLEDAMCLSWGHNVLSGAGVEHVLKTLGIPSRPGRGWGGHRHVGKGAVRRLRSLEVVSGDDNEAGALRSSYSCLCHYFT